MFGCLGNPRAPVGVEGPREQNDLEHLKTRPQHFSLLFPEGPLQLESQVRKYFQSWRAKGRREDVKWDRHDWESMRSSFPYPGGLVSRKPY